MQIKMQHFFEEMQPLVRPVLIGLGLCAVLVVVVVLFAYCGASSKTDVPKSTEHQTNANALHNQSVQAETEANTIRERVNEVDAERKAVRKELEAARERSRKAEGALKKTKEEYENLRKSTVVIDNSDLTARERRLLTELRQLQDGQ